jgi:hypothetical protein
MATLNKPTVELEDKNAKLLGLFVLDRVYLEPFRDIHLPV